MAKKKKELMRVVQVIDYDGSKIYIRWIYDEMFVWDVVHNGQLYTGYIIMKPEKGKKKLTDYQAQETINMCYAGACASVDMLNNKELSKKDKENVEIFESGRKNVEKLKN